MEGMESVQEIIKRLLARTTASSEIPSLTYKCEKCKDSGWIEMVNEDGIRLVGKCACRLAREAEHRLAVSGLADAVRDQTFDAFEVTTPVQKHLKETAQNYLTDLLGYKENPRRPWLYIGGNPGSGKTHICTAVCGEILKENIGVKYMQWLYEARRLKSYVNEDDFENCVREYIDISVLYIDDFLKQKYTENPTFTEADIKIAFTILNGRYIRNKPTIISSEWNLIDQLMPADEGVFSRVYERSKGYIVNIGRNMKNNYRVTGGTYGS